MGGSLLFATDPTRQEIHLLETDVPEHDRAFKSGSGFAVEVVAFPGYDSAIRWYRYVRA